MIVNFVFLIAFGFLLWQTQDEIARERFYTGSRFTRLYFVLLDLQAETIVRSGGYGAGGGHSKLSPPLPMFAAEAKRLTRGQLKDCMPLLKHCVAGWRGKMSLPLKRSRLLIIESNEPARILVGVNVAGIHSFAVWVINL